MSQFDRQGRQQGDFQQEGYSSQNRQQSSQDQARRFQGTFGQEEQTGERDWSRAQGSGDQSRNYESSGQGNALRINQPRERAPYESNYGLESNHPSYQSRGASVWSNRSSSNQDFGQGYGGYGGPGGQSGMNQDQNEQFDPDYHQWRRDQLQSLDNDYRQFRQERYKKFSDEFSTWRSGRSQQGEQQGGQQAGKQEDQQQASLAGLSEAGKQGKDKDKDK